MRSNCPKCAARVKRADGGAPTRCKTCGHTLQGEAGAAAPMAPERKRTSPDGGDARSPWARANAEDSAIERSGDALARRGLRIAANALGLIVLSAIAGTALWAATRYPQPTATTIAPAPAPPRPTEASGAPEGPAAAPPAGTAPAEAARDPQPPEPATTPPPANAAGVPARAPAPAHGGDAPSIAPPPAAPPQSPAQATPTPPSSPAPAPAAPQSPPTSARPEAKLACVSTLYASTEVAAHAIEAMRLARGDEAWGLHVQRHIAEPTVASLTQSQGKRLAAIVEHTIPSDWRADDAWFDATTPPMAVKLKGVPDGTTVSVSLEIQDPATRNLLAPGQATTDPQVLLSAGAPGVVKDDASGEWTIRLDPQWNHAELYALDAAVDAQFTVTVAVHPPAGGNPLRALPTLAHRMRVMPPSAVQARYPMLIPALVHVIPGHPRLDSLADRIASKSIRRQLKVEGLGKDGTWREHFLWFREFLVEDVRTSQERVTQPTGPTDDPIVIVRPIHRLLVPDPPKGATITPLETAILLASALERTVDAFMFVVRGQVAVGYYDRSLKMLVAIDCSLLGAAPERIEAARSLIGSHSPIPENPDFRTARDKLGKSDEAMFETFLVAMQSGTLMLEDAVLAAENGGGAPPLDGLLNRRAGVLAQLLGAKDPSAMALLREDLRKIDGEISMQHLMAIHLRTLDRLGLRRGHVTAAPASASPQAPRRR